MSAGTITITAGRPNRQGEEKDFAGPDGTYPVTLAAVSDEITEKSTLADAKGDGTWTYRIWTLALDGGEYDGQVIDLRANARSSGPSSRSTPRAMSRTSSSPSDTASPRAVSAPSSRTVCTTAGRCAIAAAPTRCCSRRPGAMTRR